MKSTQTQNHSLGICSCLVLSAEDEFLYSIWQNRLIDKKELDEHSVGYIRDAWEYHEFRVWALICKRIDPFERIEEDLSTTFELSRACIHPIHPTHPTQKPVDHCPVCEVQIGLAYLDLITAAGLKHGENFGWKAGVPCPETWELRQEWYRAKLHVVQTVFRIERDIPGEREWELKNVRPDLDMKPVRSAQIAVRIAKERIKYPAAYMSHQEFETLYGEFMNVDNDNKSVSFAPDTNFTSGRDEVEFNRSPIAKDWYKPGGKHSASPEASLADTSFMVRPNYNLSQMKLYVTSSQEVFERYLKSPELLPEEHEGQIEAHWLSSVLTEEFRSLLQIPESRENLYKQCVKGDALVVLVDTARNLMDYGIVETPHLERTWRSEGLKDGWACSRDFPSC